jgi:hypothetical protein
MEETRNAYEIVVGKPEGGHSKDLGADVKKILEWMLGK